MYISIIRQTLEYWQWIYNNPLLPLNDYPEYSSVTIEYCGPICNFKKCVCLSCCMYKQDVCVEESLYTKFRSDIKLAYYEWSKLRHFYEDNMYCMTPLDIENTKQLLQQEIFAIITVLAKEESIIYESINLF